MKKHIIKRTLCLALSLMLSTATMTTMNAYAATNQYAYSIGCNHGSLAWLTGGYEGDFTDNVNYATITDTAF